MIRFIGHYFAPIIAALILVSQVATVITIRRIAPGALLMHPKARKFRTLVDILFLSFCFAPFYNKALGVAILIASLLIAASFIGDAWRPLALGELESVTTFDAVVRRASKGGVLWSIFGNAACFAVISLVMFVLSPHPSMWGYWPAVGVAYYAFVIATNRSIVFYRAFRRNTRLAVGG